MLSGPAPRSLWFLKCESGVTENVLSLSAQVWYQSFHRLLEYPGLLLVGACLLDPLTPASKEAMMLVVVILAGAVPAPKANQSINHIIDVRMRLYTVFHSITSEKRLLNSLSEGVEAMRLLG